MAWAKDAADTRFAAAQLIARLDRPGMPGFPVAILADLLGMRCDVLAAAVGETPKARRVVTWLRTADPNHVVFDVLGEAPRLKNVAGLQQRDEQYVDDIRDALDDVAEQSPGQRILQGDLFATVRRRMVELGYPTAPLGSFSRIISADGWRVLANPQWVLNIQLRDGIEVAQR